MRERLRRNLTGKLTGEVGSRLVSFAFNLVLARSLGKADFGRYSYAYAFAGLIALCGELGLNTLLTREAARDREQAARWLRAFAPLRLLSISAVALGTIALALGIADRSRLLEIALMTVFMAANTLLDYHTAIFTAFERMGHDAGMRIVTRLTVALFGIGAVLLGAPLIQVMAAVAVGNSLSALNGWLWRRRVGLTFGLGWDPAFVARSLLMAIPMAAAWIGSTLYLYMDNLVLGALRFSDADIGQYSAAAKILEASQALPLIVVGGIFPVVAELSRTADHRAIAPFFTRVSRLCLVVGAPVAGVCAVIAPPVARLLYGAEYGATGPALALLALCAPLYFSNLIAIYLLLALGRPWTAAAFRLGASALKICIMLVTARFLGALCAAVGMLCADGALFVFVVFWRRARSLSEPGEAALILKVGLASLLAAGAWLGGRALPVGLQAIAVGLTFLLAFDGLGLLRPSRLQPTS